MDSFRGLTKEKKDKILRILKRGGARSRSVHIVTSHYDPDSIACVIMMRAIIRACSSNKNVLIHIPGTCDNFEQNVHILERFGLNDIILPLDSSFAGKVGPNDITIFVDTPSHKDSRFPKIEMPRPNILFDHHLRPEDLKEEGDNECFWFDNCGACISMIAKFGSDIDIFKKIEERELRRIATLGILGIFADTKKLTSRYTRNIDYDMAAFLRKYADQEKIRLISFSEYSESLLDSLRIPKECWQRKGSVLVFCSNNNDTIPFSESNMPKIADLLMKFREVQTVYVWGVYKGRIVIKARNSNKDLDLDAELKRIFGSINGGAKDNSSGAAMVPVGFLGDALETSPDIFLRICSDVIKGKIFGKIGVK